MTPHLPTLALALLLALCTPSPSRAATISGNLQTTSGNPYVTNALFAPLSTPLASGTNIIASTPTNIVAGANGSFSLTLKQGTWSPSATSVTIPSSSPCPTTLTLTT